jgi:hypothetical protein
MKIEVVTDLSQHHNDKPQNVNKQNSEGLGLNQSASVVKNKDVKKTSLKPRKIHSKKERGPSSSDSSSDSCSSSDSDSTSSSSDYSTDDLRSKSRRRKRNKKRHNKRSHKRSRHRSKSIPRLDDVVLIPVIQNQQGLLMNNNPIYYQNLRVLSTKTIEKIQKFDYVSIMKARDFWEQEKKNENDMELFNQLIDISVIEGVNLIIYSYFMRKDQPDDANQAINWRQAFHLENYSRCS